MGHRSKQAAMPPPPPLVNTDLMDGDPIAARQHAEFQALSRQGMMSTFLTSSRGTEGVAGAGLKPPAGAGAAPIVGSGTPDAPIVDQVAADRAKGQALDEAARKRREAEQARDASRAPGDGPWKPNQQSDTGLPAVEEDSGGAVPAPTGGVVSGRAPTGGTATPARPRGQLPVRPPATRPAKGRPRGREAWDSIIGVPQ